MMMAVAILSTIEAAEELGISEGHVRRLCIDHDIGRKINERARVLQEEDLQKLRDVLSIAAEKKVGRPRKKS